MNGHERAGEGMWQEEVACCHGASVYHHETKNTQEQRAHMHAGYNPQPNRAILASLSSRCTNTPLLRPTSVRLSRAISTF